MSAKNTKNAAGIYKLINKRTGESYIGQSKNIDERCADLDYIMDNPRKIDTEYFMSNNFAFGGINTSLIFKRI